MRPRGGTDRGIKVRTVTQPSRPALREVVVGLTVLLFMIAGLEFALVQRAIAGGWYGGWGSDLALYLEAATRWTSGGTWYAPAQLAGPYVVESAAANVYPPTLLYLTLPFVAGLPLFLWWAIPLGISAAALWTVRPAPWGWAMLAIVLIYPRTWTVIVAGNPAIWSLAAIVAGVAWNWPAVGATLKLTLAPFALIGIRRRSWWIAAACAFVLALPFGSLWIDYVHVLANATSSRGAGYVLGEIPIALGLLAVALSGQRSTRARQPLQDDVRGSVDNEGTTIALE